MSEKNIYITREIPAIGIEMLRAKGYSVEVGTSKVPLTKEDLLKIASGKDGKKYDGIITLLTDKITLLVLIISMSNLRRRMELWWQIPQEHLAIALLNMPLLSFLH
jgi:predicted nucleic acid binding AN1-type Zn finger protein